MVTLQIVDSKKKVRTLVVLNGFTNDHGTKCAQVKSDNGKCYLVRVQADGSGTCDCESRKPCYHIKAIASADLLTTEELEQVAANAELDIVSAAIQVVKQVASDAMVGDVYEILGPTKKITCPGCGKQDEHYYKYGKCYWIPDYKALAE